MNSDADLAAKADSGSGTVADPYVIENKRIDATGQGAGIYVRNTTKALIIRNCWVSNAVSVDPNWGPGANIMVYSEGPCVIEKNRCDNSSGDGMKLAIYNSRISNNTIWGTLNGINLVTATYCTIDNNTITGTSWTGIAVIMVSELNTISNNTITNCNRGISLESQGNHNLVQGNLITGGNIGVNTFYGSHNDILNNILLKTSSQGVYLDPVGSNGNRIVNNAFIGCNSGNPQAYDSLSNLWNGSASGNYWHDHTSPDSDYNRIVDVPYAIGGSGGNYDNYPMTSTLRIIDPVDMSTTESSSASLSGTLLNPYNIASFVWHNDASGESGNCSGLQYWTAEVPLLSGRNDIFVTMTDEDGRTFRDNITVHNTAPTLSVDPENGSTTYTSAGKFNVTVDAGGFPGLADIYLVLESDYMGMGYRLGDDPLGAMTYHGVFELDLFDGLNEVTVFVNDTAGHMVKSSLGLFRDSYPPVIEFTYLPDGSCLNDDSVEITWTFVEFIPFLPDAPLTEIYYSMDGPDWIRTYNGSVVFPDLDDGDHYFQIKAVDAAGNVGVNGVNFTLDTRAPTLEILTPLDGAIYDVDDVPLDIMVDDALSGVAGVQYRLNGGTWYPVMADSTFLMNLTDNNYLLELRAQDYAGNENITSVEFTVDTTAPEVTITSPAEGGYSSNRIVTWTVNDVSGANLSEVSTDGINWMVVNGTSRTFTLPDGTHTVYVRVTDHVGLVGTDNVTFTIDTLVPTVDIISPSGDAYNNTGSVKVIWSSADSNGITKTEVSKDGSTWSVVTGTSATISGLTDGTWTLYVRVTDVAGNTMTDSATVGVSLQGASVELVPNETVYTRENSFDITADISDTAPFTSVVLRVHANGVLVSEEDLTGDVLGDKIALLSSTIALTEGINVISLTVNDSAGNSVTVEVQVFFDTTAPTLDIDFPAVGDLLNYTVGIAMWTASDNENGSGLNNTWAKVDDDAWMEIGSAEGWIFAVTGDGEHALFVRVDDLAGNRVEKNVTFYVDATVPTAEVSPTGDDLELDSVVVVEFSEQMNVTSVSVIVEGVTGNVTWEGNVLTFTPTALEYATDYLVTVYGKDLAGNAMEMNWTFTTTAGTGSLTGTLVDEDGEPISNVTVHVGDHTAVTNELGRFVLNDLAPGNYVLTVETAGYEMYSDAVSVVAGESDELGELTLVAEGPEEDDDGGDNTLLIVIVVVAIIAVAGVAAVIFLKRKP